MGLDYYRMRLLTDDVAEVKRLIDLQALIIRQEGYQCPDLIPFNSDYLSDPEQRRLVAEQYHPTIEALQTLIEIEPYDPDGFPNSMWPLVAKYDIFPAEWRLASHRSYLPEDVGPQLNQWVSYLQKVQQGHYHSYLLQWFLYDSSKQLMEVWVELNSALLSALQRDNAWSNRLQASTLPARIQDCPSPLQYAPPLWSEWKDDNTPIDPNNNALLAEFMAAFENLNTLRREWNYAVPTNRHVKIYSSFSFQNLLNLADQALADKFMSWMKQCVIDGKGLFWD